MDIASPSILMLSALSFKVDRSSHEEAWGAGSKCAVEAGALSCFRSGDHPYPKTLSVLDLTLPHPPRYRKVVSNVCEGGVDLQQSPVQLQCPLTAPRGLQVSIRGDAVSVRPREDVLFVVRQEQVSIHPGLSPEGQFQPGTQG